MKKIILCFALSFSSLARCQEELKMWLATSVRDSFVAKIKDNFEKETGIKIVYAGDTTTGSSNDYFKDVVAGKVEAAASPISYEDWAGSVKKDGVVIPADITQRVIGFSKLIVWANDKIKLKSLSLEQLEGLTSGRVKNWKEVGGADLSVTLSFCPNKTATNTAFQKMVLKGKDFAGKIVNFDTFEAQLKMISDTPGAFGITPGSVTSKLKVILLETPPLGRPITLISRGRPSKNLQRFIEYAQAQAPKILGK